MPANTWRHNYSSFNDPLSLKNVKRKGKKSQKFEYFENDN